MLSPVLTRSMASAAKAVKVPKQLFGVAGTYATALFTAAAQATLVADAGKSLAALEKTVSGDDKVAEVLANPALSADARGAVVKALGELVPNADKLVLNFLSVLAENNRLGEFSAVAKAYAELQDAYEGQVEATVTSATELDSKTLNRIKSAISASKYVGAGQELKLTNVVDASILGGLVVEVADRTADLSIAAKVAKLNLTLTEAL